MQAIRWKFPAMRVAGSGHSLREAEHLTAAIATSGPGMNTIMGYRPGDAERERSPVDATEGTRSMTLAVQCGILPDRVDREHSLFLSRSEPAAPDSLMAGYGIAVRRGISSAGPGSPARVPW